LLLCWVLPAYLLPKLIWVFHKAFFLAVWPYFLYYILFSLIDTNPYLSFEFYVHLRSWVQLCEFFLILQL
jgi:hypothetical protein